MRLEEAPPWCGVLVGLAPSRSSDPAVPVLGGRSGRFLAELAGVPTHALAFLFVRVNLLGRLPERVARGDLVGPAWGVVSALGGRRAVLLGRDVAGACGARVRGLGSAPWLEWRPLPSGSGAVMPHPSGRNRWWNSQDNRAAARAFLREEMTRIARKAMEDIPDGVVLQSIQRIAEGDFDRGS